MCDRWGFGIILVLNLERAQKEITEENAKSETLDQVVSNLKSELKKP